MIWPWRFNVLPGLPVLIVLAVWAASWGQETRPASRPVINPLEMDAVFPGSLLTHGLPVAQIRAPAGCEVVDLHAADGVKIVALFAKSAKRATPANRPTIVFFYGNAMCLAQSIDPIRKIQGLGYNVIAPDYEGFGLSGGWASETGCYAAADAVYEYLLTRKDVDSTRIVAVGWSLGGAIAIDLANRKPVAGLASFCAFTSIADMIAVLQKKIQLPGTITFASRFDNLGKIGSITCPIFLAQGTNDELVPPEMLSRLIAAAKVKPTVLRVPGAGHNDLFQRGGDGMWNRFKLFVDGLPKAAPATRPQ